MAVLRKGALIVFLQFYPVMLSALVINRKSLSFVRAAAASPPRASRIMTRPLGSQRRRMIMKGSSANEASTSATTTTLAPGSHESEMVVKKSRFLGYAKHVETWSEAKEYIDYVKTEHPKGRHWCYGFVAGFNPVQERCSDDGEPTGTAGLPILGGIKGEELSDVVCVVVRYFGGIKLGAGGLIRAYGGASRQVLRDAPKQVLIPKTTFRVKAFSSYAGSVYDTVAKVGGVASDEEYTANGDILVSLTCETQNEDRLRDSLTDATRGSIEFFSLDNGDDSSE